MFQSLLVRDVPVAAQHHFPAAAHQCLQVRAHGLEKAELGQLPLRRARPRREIHRDHREVAEAGFDIAALAVELVAAEAAVHAVGLRPAVDADAAVAALFGE
jgi:hypothetical protein